MPTKHELKQALSKTLENTLSVGVNKDSLMKELMKAVDIWEQKEMELIVEIK